MKPSPYIYDNTAEVLEKLANELSDNMQWSYTAEGHDYWSKVFAALKNHARRANATPGTNPARSVSRSISKNKSVKETLLQTYHIEDKGYVLCGLKKAGSTAIRGHSFVSVKDKEKATCLLCKSKLLNH